MDIWWHPIWLNGLNFINALRAGVPGTVSGLSLSHCVAAARRFLAAKVVNAPLTSAAAGVVVSAATAKAAPTSPTA